MSHRSQIRKMREQGYTHDAIANRFGVTTRQVYRLLAKPEKPDSNLVEFKPSPELAHVAQIDDDLRRAFAHDREPSDEMKAKLESRIRTAKRQLRERHLADMRER